MTEVLIDTATVPMRAVLREPAIPAPHPWAVLLLHGWTSDGESYQPLADRLHDLGHTTLAVDLPGHGRSAGDRDRYTYRDFIDAAVAAADFLAARASTTDEPDGSRPRLAIAGTSLGGFLAVRVAAVRPVAALALWVPTDFADDLVDGGAVMAETSLTPAALAWRSQPHPPEDSATLRAVADFPGPMFILEAAEDELVPHQTTANYLAAAALGRTRPDHVTLAAVGHILRAHPDRHTVASALTAAWLTAVTPARVPTR
ncbi:MAG: alpha/beta fold hydrolase [Pseudoclavibacter sp.]